jgi:hypothetical protein
MKKILGIVVLCILFSTTLFAGDSTSIKKGSGPLKLNDQAVEFFHIYLTEKLTYETHEAQNLPGMIFPGGTKARYANFFFIQGKDRPYIWGWWNDANIRAAEGGTFGCKNGACKQFARKNKIVWKGAKKKISRKVTLDELKTILKELGFYD